MLAHERNRRDRMATTANLIGAMLVVFQEIAGTSLLVLSIQAVAFLTFGRRVAQHFLVGGIAGSLLAGISVGASSLVLVQIFSAKVLQAATIFAVAAIVALIVTIGLWFACRRLERLSHPPLRQAIWAGLLVPLAIWT